MEETASEGPESVIIAAAGWETASMFRRYAIDSYSDQQQLVERLEQARVAAPAQAQSSRGTAGVLHPEESEPPPPLQ